MEPVFEYDVHPLALAYPEMPRDEFEGLKQSIREHGLKEPIVLWEDKVLDGRHRNRALKELVQEGAIKLTYFKGYLYLNHLCTHIQGAFENEGEAKAYVDAKNLHRRHLTTEQKRQVITAALVADPARSDRQIATEAKVSPTTVGTIRKELEQAGDVSKLDTRRDTQGREQPSTKPSTKPERAAQNVQQIQQKTAEKALQTFWGEEESADLPVSPVVIDAAAAVGAAVTEQDEQSEEDFDTVSSLPLVPSPSWRVGVGENLREAKRLLSNALAQIPDNEIFGTGTLRTVLFNVIEFGLDVAIRDLSELPEPAPMTEEEAMEFLAEETTVHEEARCVECGEAIPLDLLGSPVEDVEDGTALLESGVYVVTPEEGDPFYFCQSCGSGGRDETDWTRDASFGIRYEGEIVVVEYTKSDILGASAVRFCRSGVTHTVNVSGNHMMRYETPRRYAEAAVGQVFKQETEAEVEITSSPDWMTSIEDRGEGGLFGGGVAKKPKPTDTLGAFTH